jgi:hypothetical protein
VKPLSRREAGLPGDLLRAVFGNVTELPAVFSSLAIAEQLMSNDAPPACWTPAGLMGEAFILSLHGTSKLDLSRPSA